MRPVIPSTSLPEFRTRALRPVPGAALLLAALALPLASCDLLDSVSGASCSTYDTDYAAELQKSGELVEAIPAVPDNFPMGLVLNTRAVNFLFARLADTELPELRQTFSVLSQRVTVIVQPEIPLLQIGGNARCPECLSFGVPLSIGVGINNPDPSRVAGQLTAQMPVSMLPVDNRRTSLVAQFQGLTVTGIDVDLPSSIPDSLVDPASDVASELLTNYLKTEFENAKIATFDSWELGQGQVLLAGRGPFVYPENDTILIAMQSNLPLEGTTTLDVQTQLPTGADIGFVFHPSLLLSLSRRMNYEGVVPASVDDQGNSLTDSGSSGNRVTLQSMTTTDDQLLRTGVRLWRTDSFCGTADLEASMGLSVGTDGFAFTIRDVQFTNGEGFGSLLGSNWVGGDLLNGLLSTLDVTINYDQIFGGERAEQAEMGAFQANIDARGITVYLNVIDEGGVPNPGEGSGGPPNPGEGSGAEGSGAEGSGAEGSGAEGSGAGLP